MSFSKTFEVADREYEVHTDNFHPGSPGSYWDPPDPPEWERQNIVDVTYYTEDDQVRLEDVVTWETFLVEFALYHHLTLEKAEEKVYDEMCEAGLDHYREMDDE